MIAREKALYWRRKFPGGDWRAARDMADFLDVPVNVLYLPNPKVTEVYYQGELWIDLDLSPERRLWKLLHGLAHVLMHAGDQQWLLANGHRWTVRRQEQQAERLPAFYLAPELTDIWRLPPEKRLYRLELERVCAKWAA